MISGYAPVPQWTSTKSGNRGFSSQQKGPLWHSCRLPDSPDVWTVDYDEVKPSLSGQTFGFAPGTGSQCRFVNRWGIVAVAHEFTWYILPCETVNENEWTDAQETPASTWSCFDERGVTRAFPHYGGLVVRWGPRRLRRCHYDLSDQPDNPAGAMRYSP